MTLDDSKLLSNSIYSAQVLLNLGMEPCCLLNALVKSSVSIPIKLFRLTHVFHIPQLSQNLLSIMHLCRDNNCSVDFDFDFVHFKE